jgi:ribosomal-protein-alanine N-acetyltransferase
VFWILCGETHLLNLAVSPACRGRGLGRATLRTVIRLSRAKGSGKVMLEAREDNVPAVNLYLSEGFRTVGKRRGYYGGGKTDALSMTLILE